MVRRVGKPSTVDRGRIMETLMKYKNQIILENGKLRSKLDRVWHQLSTDLNNKLKPETLYSMVCKAEVRQLICPLKTEMHDATPDIDAHELSYDSTDLSIDAMNDSSVVPGTEKFAVWVKKCEFENLMEQRVHKRREAARGGKVYYRQLTALTPGIWEEWVSDKIYATYKSTCAYNFHDARLIQDGTTGKITGTCNCGGTIKCHILNTANSPDARVRIDCVVRKGKGMCGKRFLRAPIRQRIGEQLRTKSAIVWRAEQADEKMQPGDPEPPTLYKKSALNNARHEYEASQYLDQDPLRAMQIMKLELLQNSIHGIGLDPFFVHYYTNHQLHIFREYAKKEPACVCIDATGGIVRSLEKCDGTKSGHLFLYHIVVNNAHGQFSVSQMVSERHTTVSISYWLADWVSQAGIHPKEVVCDSSKALLTASIRTFTGYATIEDYANACSNPVLPPCYVRIDVAHFIKMYANVLKNSSKRTKVFYLAVLGQFIQSRDIHTAREMLTSILIVARSETDGNLRSGQQTQCEIHRNFLKGRINPCDVSDDEVGDPIAIRPELDSVFDANEIRNYWYSWGQDVDLQVKNAIEVEEGDHDNAHYLPEFANRLLKDIRWLPLWSSVCRDQFGYGRIPASSAAVESEFNIIKSHLLRNDPRPLRVDTFLQKHIGHINGRTKIIDAKAISSNAVNTCTADSVASLNHRESDSLDGAIHVSGDFNITSIDTSIDSFPEFPQSTVTPGELDDSFLELPQAIDKADPLIQGDEVSQTSLQSVKKIFFESCTLCSAPLNSSSLCTVAAKPNSMVCVECANLCSTEKILASREIENWRGLTSAKIKQKSRYLVKNHITFDAISNDGLSTIPIMKNGNSTTLQSSKFGSAKYSFTKTCAFDSAMNAILVPAFDRPEVREAVLNLKAENPLLNLVANVLDHGVRAHSYQLRAHILKELHQPVKSIGNNHLIDCETNVCQVFGKMFLNTPSVREISPCVDGCEYIEKSLRTINIKRDLLLDPAKFMDFFSHVFDGRRGYCAKCKAPTTHKIIATGPFLIMEMDDDVGCVTLDEVPKEFSDTLSDCHFKLIGLIDFTPPVSTRSSMTDYSGIGHYRTISIRPPNLYFQYDDTKVKSKPVRLPGTYKARPHALVWFKFAE